MTRPHEKVKCLDVTAVVVKGNEATIYGHALHEGSETTYVITVTDNGGAGDDTFTITTADGYRAAGILANGNVHVNDE